MAHEQAFIVFVIVLLVIVAVGGSIAAFVDRRRARRIDKDLGASTVTDSRSTEESA